MQAYEQLELKFAEWVGDAPECAVACNSGTSALHLALEALRMSAGLPLNSSILVPEFTMVACARAAVMAGLRPIFVDCGDDLLMHPKELHRISQETSSRFIMPVHIYGRGCAMRDIAQIADYNNSLIIEDCAEYHGAPISGVSDAYCWSFYKNKIVCGEEGGMVLFYDPNVATLARRLRMQGFTEAHDFLHVPRGFNARMTNSQATMILESLRNVEDNLKKRRDVEQRRIELTPPEWRMPPRDVVWVYDMQVPEGVKTQSLVQALNANGIAARLAFKPMSEQEEFYFVGVKQTNAYKQSRRVFYLPVTPEMTSIANWQQLI